MRHWLNRFILLLVLTIVVVAAAIAWRLWRALPELDGTVRVHGLRQAVEVVRDPEGVPHIRAQSEGDALFALGYVHAQDRLWQMEVQRRIASGRLSEVLGPAGVETDRLMRTIGFTRAAAEALQTLPPETRALIDAYVAGVNAHIGSHPGTRLPVEFALLRFAPAPFRAEDVIAWVKVLGWGLSTNWREELLGIRLAARVGPDGATTLLPAYAADGPVVLPGFRVPPRAPETRRSGPMPTSPPRASSSWPQRSGHNGTSPGRLLHPLISGGSNNWVISGTRTATGKPVLANDPHLPTRAPAIFYIAQVTGGSLDVIGATFPGVPLVVIGHNRRIAWGATNMMSDVQDLFAERLNERDEALADGRWEPMRVLHETIRVRGGPDETLRVRITRHGPLLSDVLDERTPLALRWTGHDAVDRTSAAFLAINRAGSWTEFVAAFRDYRLPMQNFVYADVDGNIGYVGQGALPIRNGDGRWPLDGSVSANDWRGYVPQSELPRSLNPAPGFIASANNQVVPDSYPYAVSTVWEPPYRAARITSVLESLPRATLDDLRRLQTDQHSVQADRILPFLLGARVSSDAARAALARLKSWNKMMAADSPAAVLFESYYTRAASRIFSDELGSPLWAEYRRFSGAVAKAFDAVARTAESPWCDDVTTDIKEDCGQILGEALESALKDVGAVQGSDPSSWRWDRQNVVWFPHLPFQASPVLRVFFSRRVARGGDAFTVDPSLPLHGEMLVASYRQIIDLSDLDRSLFILPLGESGQLLSGHDADLLKDWNEGRYRPLRFSSSAVDEAATHRLRMEPAR